MIGRGKAEKKAVRSARLAAALRENLKRRKAQARGRAGAAAALENPKSDAPDFRRNPGWNSGPDADGNDR